MEAEYQILSVSTKINRMKSIIFIILVCFLFTVAVVTFYSLFLLPSMIKVHKSGERCLVHLSGDIDRFNHNIEDECHDFFTICSVKLDSYNDQMTITSKPNYLSHICEEYFKKISPLLNF